MRGGAIALVGALILIIVMLIAFTFFRGAAVLRGGGWRSDAGGYRAGYRGSHAEGHSGSYDRTPAAPTRGADLPADPAREVRMPPWARRTSAFGPRR